LINILFLEQDFVKNHRTYYWRYWSSLYTKHQVRFQFVQ